MRTSIKHTLAIALVSGFACNAAAQELRSSYFMETSIYKHQLNPAFLDKAYVGMPVLGNMNVGANGTIGYSNFVYSGNFTDSHGKHFTQTTFMHPDISASDFLGRLDDENKFNVNLNINIFSVGFKAFKGFNVVEMNLRSNTSANLPYELFEFMKTAGEKEHYNIKDVGVRSQNYMELAFGHSRKITKDLTVGGKFKILLGAAYADLDVKNMDITMNENKWIIKSDAKVNAAILKSTVKLDDDTDPSTCQDGRRKVEGLDDVSFGVPGFGLALDLGATYKVPSVEGLTVSAALNDLGFISWSKNETASSTGEYTFDGFTNIATEGNNDGTNKLSDQFDNLSDDLQKMFSVYYDGKKSKTTALTATLNLAGEYKMPFYDKLKVGLLYSQRFNGMYSCSQTMLTANVRPIKCLEMSLNTSTTTEGWCCGGMLNVYTKGFNFFIGSDRIMGKVSKQFIPLNNLNANVNFGFNFPL
ncbi:MAG: DUF5723 family protein [Bacteroidaceae bacterium]